MGEGQDTTGHPSTERVSVQEAAERLGTTVDAIRKRVQRRTIAHDKVPDGRVWILLDADRTRHDTDRDTTGQRQDHEPNALISAKDETIATLREQLQAERQAHAEARRLLAAALERIPAIEAPQEASESPETVEEAPEAAESRSKAEETREELVAERALREMAETTLHEGMAEERRRREDAERERDDLREQLNARSRRQGAPETVEEAPQGTEHRSATEARQESGRRPWWRRMFRG